MTVRSEPRQAYLKWLHFTPAFATLHRRRAAPRAHYQYCASYMNRLSEHQHDLIPINVTEIITRIQRALQRQSLFRVSPGGRYLQIEADTIAAEVAAAAENLRHPLGSGAHLAQAASVHFGQHRERTQQLLHQLAQTIRDQLVAGITAQASKIPRHFSPRCSNQWQH